MKFSLRFFLQLCFTGIIWISMIPTSSAQVDNSLIGEWHGVVEQLGFGTYETEMKINSLVENEISGQTEYPPLTCGGDNVFLENADSLHVFSETITFGGNCVNGRVEIFKLDQNTIQWNWYYPNATDVSAFGQLVRQGTTNINNIEKGNVFQFSGVIPNPLSNQAKFTLKTAINESVIISLYDLNGSLVSSIFEGELHSFHEKTFFINSEDFDGGIYVLGIQGNTARRFERILVIK